MRKLILLVLLLPFIGFAQDKGTNFEHGLSWQQVKDKAKKERKYLFVDCFTTWCGPCKHMTSNVFPQEKVGEFFNKNFVNVKVQFDKTKEDSEAIKSWYADAESIDKEFAITGYPTFLILSAQGELISKIVGAYAADELIAKTQNIINLNLQYDSLLKKDNAGGPSSETLRELITIAGQEGDQKNTSKFVSAYLGTQKDLYTKANLEFLTKYIGHTRSEGFQLFLKNPKKVDSILGKGKTGEILGRIILEENAISGLTSRAANIDSLVASAQAKYPEIDINKPAERLKLSFYEGTKKWDEFEPAVLAYMKKYGAEASVELLNKFARLVNVFCKETNCLAAALEWSKRSVEETQEKDPYFMNTYANLLCRLGKKDKAIVILEKAMAIAADVPIQGKTYGRTKKYFQEQINKIKNDNDI